MTAKQKVMLVAAQFVARAREVARVADAVLAAADSIDEAAAERIYRLWQAQDVVDGDGRLNLDRAMSTKTFDPN